MIRVFYNYGCIRPSLWITYIPLLEDQAECSSDYNLIFDLNYRLKSDLSTNKVLTKGTIKVLTKDTISIFF